MASQVHPRAQAVLSYWFGEDYLQQQLSDPLASKRQLWFTGGDQADKDIIAQFSGDHAAVASGQHDEWLTGAYNGLAGVVVLDQFSRNLFRGKPEAWAQDMKALSWAERLLELGLAQQLTPMQRQFLYLPFMHSEELAVQERGVKLYQDEVTWCEANAGPEVTKVLNFALSFMIAHRDVVARWGRFPHRNAFLGRQSTPEEVAGLADGSIAKF